MTLHAYFGEHLLCIHAPTCGYGPALEHNGDLDACDHFVEPDFLLGNTNEAHLIELVSSTRQHRFGDNNGDLLTARCRACEVRAEQSVPVRERQEVQGVSWVQAVIPPLLPRAACLLGTTPGAG